MKHIIGILGLVVVAVLILIGSALGSYSGGIQRALARTYWPEKEGVPQHRVEYGEMLDSCVPLHAIDIPTQSSQPC